MPTNRRTENRKLTMAYVRAAEKAGAVFREGARVASKSRTKNGRARLRRPLRRRQPRTRRHSRQRRRFLGRRDSRTGGGPQGPLLSRARTDHLLRSARAGLLGPSLFSPDGILVPRRDGRLIAGSIFEDAGFNKSVTLSGIATLFTMTRSSRWSLA